jgi:predicted ATPase
LSELIAKVFRYKGIKLADPVTLGEAREAIASDVLSAGEKQMLSFLCYNAFANQACIFIDEPEISLHVDWQRILFPILLQQSTGNQFIVATHSPFIYSKYADKELVLSPERGVEDADAQNDREGDHRLSHEDQPAHAPC